MKKNVLCCIVLLLFTAAKVGAQSTYNDRVKKYIDQYYLFALAEQKNAGIPACITLGQGILETEAGGSELMTMANNHFGIKCNSNWSGPTFTHTDDAPDECFKSYSCAAESYHDHSVHLKTNPRYAPLFKLSTTDYASWAVCLKKCGYATNPQYAKKLIKIIEDFELQKYTYTALDSPSGSFPVVPVPAANAPEAALVAANEKEEMPAPQAIQNKEVPDSVKKVNEQIYAALDSNEDSTKIVTVNGLKAFFAHKDEMLLSYAVKYNIRYPHLLEINDLKDDALPFDMYVYLEKKLVYGIHDTHVVADGESLLMVSQKEGMQLKKLLALNLLNVNEEPVAGTVLELQKQAPRKPFVKRAEIAAHKETAIVLSSESDPRQDKDYIVIARSQAASLLNDTGNIPAPETKSAAVAKAMAADAPKEPMVAAAGSIETTKPAEIKKEEKDEDLAGLKADLDKIVYADNSKLPVEKTAKAYEAPKEQPKKEQPSEPVKPITVASANKYYTVKKGDTAFSIAKRNNITVDELYKLNNIDASGIKIGNKIMVSE